MFCINGVVVKIPLADAIKRLPYDIMETAGQPTMQMVLAAQGKNDVPFLTPMTSDMLLAEFPGAEVVENINKTSANMVAGIYGHNPVFGDDHDGVLK